MRTGVHWQAVEASGKLARITLGSRPILTANVNRLARPTTLLRGQLMSGHIEERIQKYNERIALLEEELRGLDGDWTKIPRVLWASVLAVPALVVWGLGAAALTLFLVFTATGMAWYFYSVRRSEWRHMINDTKSDLERFMAQYPRK